MPSIRFFLLGLCFFYMTYCYYKAEKNNIELMEKLKELEEELKEYTSITFIDESEDEKQC